MERERTLDSIRPSDIEDINADASYLYGRDPSILAFGQRPIPSSKQNLMSLYEDEEVEYPDETNSAASDSIDLQTIKVYLRMKPFPRKLKLTKEQADAYRIANSTTLVTKLPSFDHTFNSIKGQKNMDAVCRKFTFSQTFGPETTQLQLFEEVIQQKMIDFLGGQNCTVMTYGTTNSGKSYTLQGTTTSPGIIPRGLEFVFSNVNPRPTPCYKPTHSSNVICLNAVDRAQEIEAKNKLLTFASIDKHQYINAYKQMQKLLQEESPIRPSQACDAHYSVWVSFAEIYNENIYDLLSNDCQKRRPLLKLAADSHDRAFIKGLKTVSVNSGSEAYQVLMAGQYNLKVAATALNARSSRSHCIFTIQLLKYYIENSPESVEVSTFTFCDLAGSERLKKTLNVGDRLKEAQNINTSLLVLGRCLKSIYEAQSVKVRQEHVGPFRESKLTRLFQRALLGKEQIALIVNVNPIPNLYVETQNVLNFSAIAKKIIVEPKKIHRKISNSRFSQIVARSVKSNTDWDPVELCHIVESSDATETASVFINPEDYEDLLEENKLLKNEIGSLKASMLNKDLQIRQELTKTYTTMIKKLETDWKNRIKDVEAQTEDHFEWRVNMVEAFYKDKLSELSSRKRRRTNESGNDDDCEDIDQLELENSRLQEKVKSLKKTVKRLRDSNDTLLTEKNKLSFQFGLANDELKSLKDLLSSAQNDLCKDNESITYVEELRKQLSDKQEHVKKLKEFLNEAKEEYISISSHAEMMENRLKETEETLAESTEYVADLKSLLENTNACLEEKTKATDALEEKINQQSIAMLKAEEQHRKIESKLMETIDQLKEKLEASKKSSTNDNTTTYSMMPDVHIKKEVLSASEDEVSPKMTKAPIPDGIFIKTDRDEILGIPASSYNDDRESEIYLQVREVGLNATDNEVAKENLSEAQAKLYETEKENLSLKNKLSQSCEEVKSLKESLNSTKEQFNDITKRLKESEAAQDICIEARARDDSVAAKTLDQCVSLKDSDCQTNSIAMSEDGNQTDAVVNFNKSMQTSFVAAEENYQSVRTSTSENDELINSAKLLAELEDKYSKLEADCKEKQLCCDESQFKIADLTNNLTKAAEGTESMEKKLSQVEVLREKLEKEVLECRDTHVVRIAQLTEQLGLAKEKEDSQLSLHTEKILSLEEKFVTKAKEQEEKIKELNECVELCEKKNKEFEAKIKENLGEIEVLRKRIQEADKRDQEKDEEIRTLQKSYKAHLAADINDKRIHEELKRNLKELLETKEALTRTDELYQRLRISSKKEIESLELQNSALETKYRSMETLEMSNRADVEKLRTECEELKTILNEKELELSSFTANREKMIVQYDTLVKTLQEELDRAKREITRFQELFHRLPTTPREKTQKGEDEEQKNQIQVINLSDSETKKTRKLAPPPAPPSETKRSTRKKKLYVPPDDSCVDLEVCDANPPAPSPPALTRNLRNRRK